MGELRAAGVTMADGTDGATGRGAPVVHVVLPDGVDDPSRPSGGNVYDRRLCDGLAARGWTVREHVAVGHRGHRNAQRPAATWCSSTA